MSQASKVLSIPPIGKRMVAMLAAGTVATACMGAPVAYAAEVSPGAGAQTGSGTTEITVQLKNAAGEVGGAGSEGNPDSNGDGYGDNIAFSVPTSINFVVNGNGSLTGPTNARIENHSKFSIHGSALAVTAATGWNIVADASAESQSNAIDFQVGPENDMLNASAFLTKANVTTPSEWNMPANDGAVALATAGDVNNVTADISEQTSVATMHWYVTPGSAL